ncbi:MAG: peptide ABC transporter substrate-binding protein, partial [Treponema sp.]|nr:peptide ABC transporter substrate-binding protein [Treponema sp.]
MKKIGFVAILALSIMLASCGGKKSTGGSSVHVQVGPSPETIDPALNSEVDGANMIIHAFEGLLKFDRNNNVVAACAEKWETSDDGLVWTFHLRSGLKWSDGSDLTAHDFEYAWKRLADPATAAPYAYDLLNIVRGYSLASQGDIDKLAVSASGNDTFVVNLSTPCTYFDKIAAFATLVPVQQKTVEAAGESWAVNPETYITNGPYYMTEFTDGSRIVFKKNPHYYDAENV